MIQNRRLHPALEKVRFSVKPLEHQSGRPVELARTMRVHPLSYQELPYDPEYSLYAGRLTPETLNLATADEMYWKVRRELIFRHTGEHPFEIRGKDAEIFLNRIFPRDVSKVKTGRCSYQFACYHDGGMITDGLLLRLSENCFWYAQADGDLFSWYKAHSHDLEVEIIDPEVWVSQIQGPRSMELLSNLIEEPMPDPWNYFDWTEVMIAGEKVIISRSGFTNELGWEIYIRPENDIEKLGDLILESGKSLGMILTATPGFRARRIEAGLLSAGADFDHTTTPFEVGLGRYLDFDKNEFIGREALIKADPKNRSWGLRVEKGIALRGRYLEQDGIIKGRVTSSSWSPFQECGIGIVLLDETNVEEGTQFQVRCNDGEMHLAEICTLPMYDTNREIVRGKKVDIPLSPRPWKAS